MRPALRYFAHLCRHRLPPFSRPRTPLAHAVTDMSRLLRRIDRLGDVFAGFQCVELDSIATVLAAAGEPETAAYVVARHAEADNEASDHHAHIRDLIEHHDSLSPPVLKAARQYVATLMVA